MEQYRHVLPMCLFFLLGSQPGLAKNQDRIIRQEITHKGTFEHFDKHSVALAQEHLKVEQQKADPLALISGGSVKIKNRAASTYLAVCSECDTSNASTTPDIICSGMIAGGKGCGFTVLDAASAGEFEIRKVGYKTSVQIYHNDLVTVKVKGIPALNGYLGMCGGNGGGAAAPGAPMRIFREDAYKAHVSLPEEAMFTIAKESGDGAVLMGDNVYFVSPGGHVNRATFMVAGADVASTGACNAKTSLTTAHVNSLADTSVSWLSTWQLEALPGAAGP